MPFLIMLATQTRIDWVQMAHLVRLVASRVPSDRLGSVLLIGWGFPHITVVFPGKTGVFPQFATQGASCSARAVENSRLLSVLLTARRDSLYGKTSNPDSDSLARLRSRSHRVQW